MKKTNTKRQDKTMYILEKFYREVLISRILEFLSKTRITPNMVTIFNIIFGFYVFWLAYKKEFILVAIAFQMYEIIDHLDGSLARYKNMSSKLGARLDSIGDFIFYNGIYFCIGFRLVNWYLIIFAIALMNIYGIIATYYIVPRLRKLKVIKRGFIKQWFMDRGYIIGMDLTLLGAITSTLLIFNKVNTLYVIIILGYLFDIVYRIVELKYNEKLNFDII